MDFRGRLVGLGRSQLLHNVDRNDTWCRQRCCAGGTHPCHVLMVKSMVKVNLALLEAHCFASRFTCFFNGMFAIAGNA